MDMNNIMPKMKMGEELLDALGELPEYIGDIQNKDSMERLLALENIYNVYIPTQMTVEIYCKLYMGLMRSLQKKGTLQAVQQGYVNRKITQRRGVLGGSDSFTIIGASGIGKSSAIQQVIHLLSEKKVIEISKPYCRIAPCIVVQCPFDSSVKGLLLEILRKIDEVIDSKYHINAVRAKATTDMLIGSVSQAVMNHVGVLIVDEIQNVVNSKNGKNLIGSLTQLINNSGISICMVGTPESIPFFEQAMQLARRSLGLRYDVMDFNEEFEKICRVLFRYQYTKQTVELTERVLEWLYEHCGGNISVLVCLLHDAQEIAILNGSDILNMESLEEAYKNRISMLHDYIEPSIQRKKQSSEKKKKADILTDTMEENRVETIKRNIAETKSIAELVKIAKTEKRDIAGLLKEYYTVDEVKI